MNSRTQTRAETAAEKELAIAFLDRMEPLANTMMPPGVSVTQRVAGVACGCVQGLSNAMLDRDWEAAAFLQGMALAMGRVIGQYPGDHERAVEILLLQLRRGIADGRTLYDTAGNA